MSDARRCRFCGEQTNHSRDELAQARCAYRTVSTDKIRTLAVSLAADPVAAADLLAHLRGPLSDPAAYDTARYVLDLGWRPVVGPAAAERPEDGQR